jgi:hypothetical protein
MAAVAAAADALLPVGASLPRGDDVDDLTQAHAWAAVAGESWNVRMGPNYKTNKKKAASAANLCELMGVVRMPTAWVCGKEGGPIAMKCVRRMA